MGKKLKVASIVIQYPDGETKELSLEDARALHEQLDDLFAKPLPWPTRPIIIERERTWPHWWQSPTCEPAQTPKMPYTKPQVWCKAGA